MWTALAGWALVGLLTLTGCITSATKAASIVKEDRTLYNHAADVETKSTIRTAYLEQNMKATAEDVTILTKLHAKLLTAKDVSSVNFHLRAVNGVVYFLGIAQSQGELDRILKIVRGTDGVRQVITHMQIKPPGSPAPTRTASPGQH